MNQQINNPSIIVRPARHARNGRNLKVALLPVFFGIALLSPAPSAMADEECGAGPVVTCTVGNYTSGITYAFSSDLNLTTSGRVGVGTATFGLRLTGSGNAGVNLTTEGLVYGVGGIHIVLETGDLNAEIRETVADTASTLNRNVGTGLHVSTAGAANLTLIGNRAPGVTPYRLSNLVMDVGSDSAVWLDSRRTVVAADLSPRAGATLTINNDGGILGNELADRVSSAVAISGSGAGHLVLNNALVRGRINGNLDFTGMTGKVTVLNDYSGNARQGGWHLLGTSQFGSGDVEIYNGDQGVIRAPVDAVLDFSDTRSALIVNRGRVMIGATDVNTFYEEGTRTLTFVGVGRFENSGLLLLGAKFDATQDKGTISNGEARDRLVFEDSHYVGMERGRIAFDALLAREGQADCTTIVVADCVRFTGSSTTEGSTLLNVRDLNPARAEAGFNPGIVLIEGASAAEHFILDPASQFYVGNSSGGPVLQKGLIAYRLQYDADTRQHALVGTLADEALQISMLGAAGQETWRVSTDTWFDRQEMLRETRDGFDPQGLWSTVNVSNGNRSGHRSVNAGGTPTSFDLGQDQTITHLAFGVDLLHGRSGGHAWRGGVTAGLLYASVDYDATRTQSTMAGLASGLYGSWSLGGLSVDGLINHNFMRQSIEGANFGLGPHNRLRTQVSALGLRLEAAWKLAMSDRAWVQPLLGISHVSVGEDDIELPDQAGGVRFDGDAGSLRVGAGIRLGLDSRIAGMRTQYRLTARHWNEQDAENRVFVDIGGEPTATTLTDDFGGGFNEVNGAWLIASESGALSASVNLKGRFGDDYRTFGGSVGVRYAW